MFKSLFKKIVPEPVDPDLKLAISYVMEATRKRISWSNRVREILGEPLVKPEAYDKAYDLSNLTLCLLAIIDNEFQINRSKEMLEKLEVSTDGSNTNKEYLAKMRLILEKMGVQFVE